MSETRPQLRETAFSWQRNSLTTIFNKFKIPDRTIVTELKLPHCRHTTKTDSNLPLLKNDDNNYYSAEVIINNTTLTKRKWMEKRSDSLIIQLSGVNKSPPYIG